VPPVISVLSSSMPSSNISVAEEALCLPPDERANLARLLIDSLDDQSGADEQIRAELAQRLARFKSGSDGGVSFQETFGKPM
jgi:putative addiction module component (TIGR02574 family)